MYQDYIPAANSWQVVSALSAVAGVVVAAIGWIWKSLNTIRSNDLHHIDLKLDSIVKGVEKIDERLERHLEWHIGEKK